MSKSKKVILFLFTIFIITLFFPKFYKVVFVLRHLSIFFIFSLLILKSAYINNEDAKKNEKVLTRDSVLNVVKAIVLLIGVSFLQLRFIQYFETPTVNKCIYYDESGNFIHSSTFSTLCSDLKILDKTDNTLKVKAQYEFPDLSENQWSSDNGVPYINIDGGFAETIVFIEYSDLGLIDYYETQTTTNYLLKKKNSRFGKDIWFETGYYSNIVTYDYEYYDDKVDLTINYYTFKEETDEYMEDIISHHDFTNKEPEYTNNISLVTYEINNDYKKSLGFDIYFDDNVSSKYGQITNEGGVTNILLDYNKESYVSIESEQVVIDNDTIYRVRNFTQPFGSYKDKNVLEESRYKLYDNLYTLYSTSNSNKIKNYIVGDKKFIKDIFGYSIIRKTEIGYKVEKYNGDGYINERHPNSYELFDGYRINGDVAFLGSNEPRYISDRYEPVFRLDPMLKYFVDKLK